MEVVDFITNNRMYLYVFAGGIFTGAFVLLGLSAVVCRLGDCNECGSDDKGQYL